MERKAAENLPRAVRTGPKKVFSCGRRTAGSVEPS
jgi:hypothetical protein